jgi:eukaryotic-like serine/threonine-protein kinase
MSLSSGAQLGHYEIRSQLGAGGMGEVFLAEDSRLDRRVALKILRGDLANDAGRMRRFVQEAKSASALNHPNILTIYEIGEINRTHFIATEYIEGETLRERIRRESLTLREALDIALQVAAALNAAHSEGIIHRDIKPENVMIREDGYVKVLDFGLAKLVDQTAPDADAETLMQVQTQPGMIMGTVAYMSPEQARGQLVDMRTDIFSLGVVMYEMVCGRQPFTGETVSHTIVAILEKEPPPLERYGKEVPAEIERIIEKALAKKASARYRSVKYLVEDLKTLRKRLEFEDELERNSSPGIKTVAQTQIIRAASTTDIETQNSIAVMPFTNMSAEAENEYFCDGLAEELLNALAKIEDLKVAARTSAFSFKGKNVEVSQIGKTLNVKSILEGSVRKSGGRVRIMVQLVNAANGYYLWSERYDREMKDIFDVQDEITLAVVDALKVKLLGEEKAALLKRYTDDAEAYELYLKGLYHYHKYTAAGWIKAIEFFEQAIDKEPELAPAHANLASALSFCWFFSVLPLGDTSAKWEEATRRALEIDDRLGEAHSALARYRFYYEWNWIEAEREFLRAIELNPDNAEMHHQYGAFLAAMGRVDEALGEGDRALELDPLSLLVNLQVGWIYLFSGRLDDVVQLARKMLAMEPNFHGAYLQMGMALGAKGEFDEALEVYRKALALGSYEIALSGVGFYCARSGKRAEAYEVIDRLLETRAKRHIAAFNIARVYAGLGEADETIEWLEKAVAERNGELVFLNTKTGTGDVFKQTLRDDPRYADLLRRVNLPQR